MEDFTWQLNVAVMGGIFSVFSLIFNEYYVFYGLITFAFGLVGHIVYEFFESALLENSAKNNYYWTAHLANLILAIGWIKILTYIY